MISGLLLIVILVTVTYAVNTWKIQMVTEGRAFCAAGLEGLQGLLFVFALMRMIALTDSTVGAAAYVVGAFLGTAGAVVASRQTRDSNACKCQAAESSEIRVATPEHPAHRRTSPRRSSRRPVGDGRRASHP